MVASVTQHELIAESFPPKRYSPVYIAGPMSNLPEHNFPAFNHLAFDLRLEGFNVENPAEWDDGVPQQEWHWYMKRDLPKLVQCKLVVALDGWEYSRGARLEVTVAQALDIPVVGESGFPVIRLWRPEPDPIEDVAAQELWDEGHPEEPPLEYPGDEWEPYIAGPPGFRGFDEGHPEGERRRGWDTTQLVDLATGNAAKEDTILQEAERLVRGARNGDYGHPQEDFDALGRMWGAMLTRHLKRPIPDLPGEVCALLMAALKLNRQSGQHKHDNLVDGVGYLYCIERIARRRRGEE